MRRLFDKAMKNDHGYTFVELLSVIAILMLITGVAALSINLVYSQDAKKAAVLIDDALSETRMLSMSKSGDFVMKVTPDSSDSSKNTIVITRNGDDENPYKKVDIDRSVNITMEKDSTEIASAADPISVAFDKSNGSVTSINKDDEDDDEDAVDDEGVYVIKVSPANGSSKIATVTIVAGTGRHFVDK